MSTCDAFLSCEHVLCHRLLLLFTITFATRCTFSIGTDKDQFIYFLRSLNHVLGKNFEFLSTSQISHEKTPATERRRITLLADAAGAIRNGVKAAEAGRKRKKKEESTEEGRSTAPQAKKPETLRSPSSQAACMSSAAGASTSLEESDNDPAEMLTCLTTKGELLVSMNVHLGLTLRSY